MADKIKTPTFEGGGFRSPNEWWISKSWFENEQNGPGSVHELTQSVKQFMKGVHQFMKIVHELM